MATLQEAEDLIKTVELDTEKYRFEGERAEVFSKAMQIMRQAGEEKRVQEIAWDFVFFRLRYLQELDVRKKSGLRFAPMIEYTNGSIFPDIKTFTDPQIEYYKKRASETKNPIHKARYNDFIWEVSHDYVYARSAIKAYLDCVGIFYKNKWEIELVDALQRATELALTLNDRENIEASRLALIQSIKTLADAKNFRWSLELIDSMIEIKRYLKEGDIEVAVKVAESGVEFYKNVPDGFHLQRSFIEKLISLMNALRKPEKASEYAHQIADSLEKEGDWKLTHYPSGDLVAAFIYQQAAASYRELGQKEKTNELLKKVKEHTEKAEAGFKEFSFAVEIPAEPVEKYIQELVSLDLSVALQKLSNANFLLPNIKSIRADVEALKGKSLALVVPMVSIRDNNPALRSETEAELIEENVVDKVVMDYKFKASIIGSIIDALVQKKGLNKDNLVSNLVNTQTFENCSNKLLEAGFERYFANDFASCLHILVPQLENALRLMLPKLGLSTSVINDVGSVKEKTLGAILREPKIIELLGEPMLYNIRSLLEDKRGDNLRNDIAHGLISYEHCTKNNANALVCIYILLLRLKFS